MLIHKGEFMNFKDYKEEDIVDLDEIDINDVSVDGVSFDNISYIGVIKELGEKPFRIKGNTNFAIERLVIFQIKDNNSSVIKTFESYYGFYTRLKENFKEYIEHTATLKISKNYFILDYYKKKINEKDSEKLFLPKEGMIINIILGKDVYFRKENFSAECYLFGDSFKLLNDYLYGVYDAQG